MDYAICLLPLSDLCSFCKCIICYSCPGLQCQVTKVALFVLFKKWDICYLFAEQQNCIFAIISAMSKGIELCFQNENLEKNIQ